MSIIHQYSLIVTAHYQNTTYINSTRYFFIYMAAGVSRLTHVCVMSHLCASCHTFARHVIMRASCHIFVRHVTSLCVMSHLCASCHTCACHVTCARSAAAEGSDGVWSRPSNWCDGQGSFPWVTVQNLYDRQVRQLLTGDRRLPPASPDAWD